MISAQMFTELETQSPSLPRVEENLKHSHSDLENLGRASLIIARPRLAVGHAKPATCRGANSGPAPCWQRG